VLLKEPAEAEDLPVCGGELLLDVVHSGAAAGAFLAEFDCQNLHDAAVGGSRHVPGGGCRDLAGSPGAQGLDAAAKIGAGVEEVEADAPGAGDGPEADVLLVLDQLADRGLSACGGGLVFCPGGAAQRVGSALGAWWLPPRRAGTRRGERGS